MKVKDELKRYLDALLAKNKGVMKMIEQLSEPYNPKPTQGTEEILGLLYIPCLGCYKVS